MHGWTAIAYLFAAVCFILALKGLSSPATARNGNKLGMLGMAVAIVTTLALPVVQSYGMILLGIAVGGAIGWVIAKKIKMTDMPQLVAAFHSLVGLAAVFVAAAALWSPEAYGIGISGQIYTSSLIEMGLGAAIGAVSSPAR